MEAYDGNAVAGHLMHHFGMEMTTATGVCRHCQAEARVAALVVYLSGPGAVVRCPSCGQVVMVVVEISGTPRLYGEAFRLKGQSE